MTNSIAINGATIVAENNTFKKGSLYIENDIISSVHSNQTDASPHTLEINLPESYTVLPGFIDVHIHGAGGADMMDATPNSLSTISSYLVKEGTTSFLATTITHDSEKISEALENAANYIYKEQTNASLIGIHLEGPFINSKRAGAQPINHIKVPSLQTFVNWVKKSNQTIKLVTLAPEMDGGLELTSYIANKNIVASIGHSDASNEEVLSAIKVGATHITHLYNGMRGFHHREPGVAGTALSESKLFVELIADGIHVHPNILKATYLAKKADRIVLITDSIRAKWLEEGQYELGGQLVHYYQGKAVLENGALAGSVLKMNEAVHNMIQFSGCSIEEASMMASQNPAKQLGIFHKVGSISAGKDADITILNENYQVIMTICKGKIVHDARSDFHENY
ncbi:N-acetylglucosamine-6-phosphate deacetylase [Alkalihalobacillus trypoxylicola]|uniref:N-acetylglucosamine-6-phosphate deacetylase n=1 Tax=Alkalihalobacillus trypoxylicola TaxID=519424 RepID=A0A162D0N2_9BACI|nr:N-acetylglucosamine-6-phosphate deacetylase [Alkalihalobacillus trypoxylicola]KYG27616.1 N-acetylglucosamine-6-phosphate deacetylase [Alkalihalobacillus trypoxylicola]